VIFTANSGHELGHLGLDDFMVRRPGWERPISEGGATWIHFGANIGAADGELSLQSASDDLRSFDEVLDLDALDGLGRLVDRRDISESWERRCNSDPSRRLKSHPTFEDHSTALEGYSP
jgi:hypothetical protein